MPRKASKPVPSNFLEQPPSVQPLLPDKEAEWGGFVNIPMTDKDKETYTAWFTVNETFLTESVAELVWAGLKLSVVFDCDNDCYIATFTGKGHPQFAMRMAMSARHRDLLNAIGLLVFKHYVMADRDWTQFTPKGEKRKWDFG